MVKFDYSKFFEEIDSSLTLHSHDIEKKIYEAPNQHNKLLKRFIIERNTLQKLESKLNRLFGQKYHHYRYEFDLNLGSKEVAIFYVKKDEEYIKANDEHAKQKLLVEIIDKYMKKASTIGFDIKNIIQFLEFMSGD